MNFCQVESVPLPARWRVLQEFGLVCACVKYSLLQSNLFLFFPLKVLLGQTVLAGGTLVQSITVM